MNRLEMYINDLHKNSTDGNVIPTILKETPSTAWIDGKFISRLFSINCNLFSLICRQQRSRRGCGQLRHGPGREESQGDWSWLGSGQRIESLWNRRMVHAARSQGRNDRNIDDKHLPTDESHTEQGISTGHESVVFGCSREGWRQFCVGHGHDRSCCWQNRDEASNWTTIALWLGTRSRW